MSRMSLALLALSGMALPAGMAHAGEEWPNADTPMLEVRAGGYVLAFPAPEWVDRARSFVEEIDGDNVRADWFTSGAISGPRTNWNDWLSVQNVEFDRWYLLSQHTSRDLRSPCEALEVPELDDYDRALHVCQAHGAGAGTFFYGIEIPMDDRAIVVAYKTATQSFVIADEASWPKSRDELIAMADRIDSLITITPIP